MGGVETGEDVYVAAATESAAVVFGQGSLKITVKVVARSGQ